MASHPRRSGLRHRSATNLSGENRRTFTLGVRYGCGVLLVLSAQSGMAQSTGPGLTTLTFANEVETQAAAANQAAFVILNEACNPDGRFDQTPVPEFSDAPVGGDCSQEAFAVFRVARELVHTANELQGSGPIASSLGSDLEGLGLALRWTAAEEFAVQSSMATDFANDQLSNLAARVSALRFGARGFSFAATPVNPEGDTRVAGLPPARGGAASGDDIVESYSPWGGFINGAFGWGKKEATDLEDPFDFDGQEITVGIDYRFDNNVILGGIVGYTEQTVDFDEAADPIIVTDGNIEADGYSFLAFGLYEGEKLALSASLGYQALDYKALRNIYYPSFNPNIESVTADAFSKPESDVYMATMNLAYGIALQRLTIEPYINLEYMDITIDQFTEDRTINHSDPNEVRNFSLIIGKQSIKSFDSAIGINLQLLLTPSVGVFVPYVGFEFHNESEDKSRDVLAEYVGLQVLNPNGFVVPTDPADSSYTQSSAGISMVFRGGRARGDSGQIYGRLQGFIQYTRIDNLDHYENEIISGGIRYAF